MLSEAAKQLQREIADAKQATDEIRNAQSITRRLGFSIDVGVDGALRGIAEYLADRRRRLGELLESQE